MSRVFLGVDVGATKTYALVADDAGRALGLGRSGPGNPEVVGYEGLARAVEEAALAALGTAGAGVRDVAGAGFGVAGYDWPREREPTVEAVGRLGLAAPYAVVNDTLVGLLAGASQGWGVAVVAGTSCNCWGWDRRRRTGRMTGHSVEMGEGAGAVELMWQAMRAVARDWSRRGPATRLTQVLAQRCGASGVDDFVEGVCTGRYRVEADAAPLVFEVADAGDPVARGVIRWAGQELGSLAVGVIRQLGLEAQAFEVVLVGSLYDGGPMLVDPMREVIHGTAPQARLVRLTAPPAIGGVLLGMEQAGLGPPGPRERLIESVRGLASCRSPG